MTQVVTFPGLGLEFSINNVAFSFGNITVYWYGIIFAVAFVVAIGLMFARAKMFGLNSDRVVDVIMVAVLAGIVGARLYYVIFEWDHYSQHPEEIIQIWRGGLGFYGGLILGCVAAFFACRWRKVKILPAFDLAAAPLLIAQSIGRWGNFINVEAFGGNTTLPWGMTGPKIVEYLERNREKLIGQGMQIDPNVPVHPTFFYESLWNFIGFFVLLFYSKKRKFDGEMLLLYLAWYGAGRAVIEGLRTDSLMLGQVRISQLVAALTAVISVALIVFIRIKMKRGEANWLPPLYVTTEESRLAVSGELYRKPDAQAAETADEAGTETDTAGTDDAEDAAPSDGTTDTGETEDQPKADPSEAQPEDAATHEDGHGQEEQTEEPTKTEEK